MLISFDMGYASSSSPGDSPSSKGSAAIDAAERSFTLSPAIPGDEDGYCKIVRDLSRRTRGRFPDVNPSYRYDAALLTLAAGIESRNYDRGPSKSWRHIDLAWPANTAADDAYYTRNVPAHVRWGASQQKHLFILLGSSYSTWQRGTWTNKTVSILRTAYDEPHMVAFAGFLTPEFLALRAKHPTLTAQEPARDLYVRLDATIARWKQAGLIPADTRIGLVGFSGGASLLISLLAEDQRQTEIAHERKERLFRAGGVAFSPVLDLPESFQVLDQGNNALTKKGFPARRALTQPIFPDFIWAFFQGFTASDPLPYLKLTANNADPAAACRRDEIIGRFYREFEIVDLVTTSEACYPGLPEIASQARALRRQRKLQYGSYYNDVVFPAYRHRFGLQPQETLETYTRIERELAAITHAPLYLVFAADDPVLSRVDENVISPAVGAIIARPSPRVAEILEGAARSPNVRVFAPVRGAHMGYFLDDNYLRAVLKSFFTPPGRHS